MTRQKVKRELLDALDAAYQFEAPSKLVEAEFNNIWSQVNRDLEAAGRTFADEETTEEEARAEYTRLAERRVRLGLVLAEIGEKAGVQVTDEELQRSLFDSVRRFPADQQQQVFEFYRNNPERAGQVCVRRCSRRRWSTILLTQVDVTDQKVSKEELMAEDEATRRRQAAEAGEEGRREERRRRGRRDRSGSRCAQEAGRPEKGSQGRRCGCGRPYPPGRAKPRIPAVPPRARPEAAVPSVSAHGAAGRRRPWAGVSCDGARRMAGRPARFASQCRHAGCKLSEEISGQGLPLPNPVYGPRPRVPFEMLAVPRSGRS